MTALAMMALEVFGKKSYSKLPERAAQCIVLFNTVDTAVASVFVATSKVPHLHVCLGPRPTASSTEVIQEMNQLVETGHCDIGGIHAAVRSFQKSVNARVTINDPALIDFCAWLDGVGDNGPKEHITWIQPVGGNTISRETCLMLVLTEYCFTYTNLFCIKIYYIVYINK
jgi:hypothetical protein